MTLFVDASALVSIIAGEDDQDLQSARIDGDDDPLWSAMSCWEAVSALRNSYRMEVVLARREVVRAAAEAKLRLVSISEPELKIALDAYERYGKGRHPAGLNFGDCFAYACAKTNNARLLYKGDDFERTDLA